MPIDLERLRRQRRLRTPSPGSRGVPRAPAGARRRSRGALRAACRRRAPRVGDLARPGPRQPPAARDAARRTACSVRFPTLRIRPDLHPVNGPVGEIDLSTRLAEAEEAVSALTEASGVRSVGLVGALSGGMVAAMVADRLGSSELALIEPVSRGKRYIRETIRRQAIAELIASADGCERQRRGVGGTRVRPAPARGARRRRRNLGPGLRLTSTEYDRIAAVDLARDMRARSAADRC